MKIPPGALHLRKKEKEFSNEMLDLKAAVVAQLKAGRASLGTVLVQHLGTSSHTWRAGVLGIAQTPIQDIFSSASLISRSLLPASRTRGRTLPQSVARRLFHTCSNTDNCCSSCLRWLWADTWQRISPITPCNQDGKTAPLNPTKK